MRVASASSLGIHRLGPGDASEVVAAGRLFDQGVRADATRRFLAEPGHHLLIAYDDEVAAGFVSGIEMTHPDKGTEMFVYELAVDEAHRDRGIGRALVAELASIARGAGCYGMWVLTGDTGAAALATYRAAGGMQVEDQAMLSWSFT